MRRKWQSLSLALVLACTVLAWSTQSESAQAVKTSTDDTELDAEVLDAKVESLLAMPAAERRAELKSLTAEQRRGLWLKVKRAQAERRGKSPLVRGSKLKGHPLTATPKKSLPALAVGTIGYDSGAPSTSFGGGSLVGNRFNTHTGNPVFSSGTVSTVVGQVVPGTGLTTNSAGFVLLNPQTGGGGATAIFSTFTTASGTADTVTFSGMGANYTGSSFFVLFGDFSSSYIPVLGTGSTLGQGHHGVVGYTGGVGPSITGTFNLGGTLNAFIRATGNIVPVELMTFNID